MSSRKIWRPKTVSPINTNHTPVDVKNQIATNNLILVITYLKNSESHDGYCSDADNFTQSSSSFKEVHPLPNTFDLSDFDDLDDERYKIDVSSSGETLMLLRRKQNADERYKIDVDVSDERLASFNKQNYDHGNGQCGCKTVFTMTRASIRRRI